MKYALLFFSFLFVFILNVDYASAQSGCGSEPLGSCGSCVQGIQLCRYANKNVNCRKTCGDFQTSAIVNGKKVTIQAGVEGKTAREIDNRLAAAEAAKKTPVSRPSGEVGCYRTISGTRKWSCDYCTTPKLKADNGCAAASSQASSFKCRDGSDPDPNNTDPNKACFCSAGVAVARDQDCPASSKEAESCSAHGEGYALSDGDCTCSKEGYETVGGKCIKSDDDGFNHTKWSELCSNANGQYNKVEKSCVCSDGRSTKGSLGGIADLLNGGFNCSGVADKSTPSCLQVFKTAAEACEKEGVQAVKECNSENKDSNDQMKTSQGIIDTMSQVMQMRGQQQGSAETCFQAGALASTSYGVLELMKKDCDEKIVTCHDECKKAKDAYNEVKDGERCNAEIARAGTIAQQEEAKKKLFDQADKIFAKLESGTEACEKDAKTNQDTLINVMNRMNKSAQQAAKCQCQLTAGQTNCDQILGPADCKLTPKDPRCPQAVTVKCAGTDYNTKECICLRDPKAVSCIGTTGSGVSQVAGFNPVGAGSTNFKTGGTGSGGGLGDFPSDAAAAVSMDKTQGGVDSPFSAAGGGGGGGSSGGGGGSDGGGTEGGAAEPEAKTGIAGLFNNLKTGVAGLFGGNSKKPTTADGKNFAGKNGAPKNVDPNQWRPVGLRGIAGGNGIGSKNSDIFKTVNNQYNNQYHTLMTLPAESPK